MVCGSSSTVYTAHGWVFNEPLKPCTKWLYRTLEKFTARNKDKIIVLSNFDAEVGQKAGIPAGKLVKIPLGINPPPVVEKQKAREKLCGINNYKLLINNFVIVTIANLYPTKGLTILIEAVKKIKDMINIDNLKFVIIGEGAERNKLEALVQNYNLANTIFLPGAVVNAAEYLPAFDLFVLPSLKEGLPYTIMEAMAAGVPIIATNVGGVSSLIDETTGKSIDPGDSEQLASTILWALKNPGETKKRAARAHEKIKEYPLAKMLTETSAIYRKLRNS